MTGRSTHPMLGPSSFEVELSEQGVTFRPIGPLDETTDFSIFLENVGELKGKVREVRFDLARVTRINSCGVRSWLHFLNQFPADIPYSFHRVSEPMIDQAGMIAGFLGKPVKVASFEAPYLCAACACSIMIELTPAQVQFRGGKPIIPEVKCRQCSAPMTFDGIEEEYFAFLNTESA